MATRLSGALLVLGLLAACSSKNPDALTGANVDENFAVASTESNAGANVEEAEGNAAASGQAAQQASAKGDARHDSDVDNAVNSLNSIEAEDNFVSEQEDQFNRENEQPHDE